MDAAVSRTLTAARAAKCLGKASRRAGPPLAAFPGPDRIRTPTHSRRVSNWPSTSSRRTLRCWGRRWTDCAELTRGRPAPSAV